MSRTVVGTCLKCNSPRWIPTYWTGLNLPEPQCMCTAKAVFVPMPSEEEQARMVREFLKTQPPPGHIVPMPEDIPSGTPEVLERLAALERETRRLSREVESLRHALKVQKPRPNPTKR